MDRTDDWQDFEKALCFEDPREILKDALRFEQIIILQMLVLVREKKHPSWKNFSVHDQWKKIKDKLTDGERFIYRRRWRSIYERVFSKEAPLN